MQFDPYTPGAGFIPAYLAGRNKTLDDAQEGLERIKARFPQRSILYYGLRGVGKTVLLNTIEEMAENQSILHAHIEARERDNFTEKIVVALRRFLREVSAKEAAKDMTSKFAAMLKAFSFTYNIEDNSIGLDFGNDVGFTSGVYSDDLTELFVTLGRALVKSGDAVCLFIDELQYLEEEKVRGLVTAIHRCNQLRLPIMVFCAGLPKVLRTVGDACSYAERLFRFEKMDALSAEASKEAIEEPAKLNNVTYTQEAVDYIVALTGGYPYFIQEMCSAIWRLVEDVDCITLTHAQNAREAFFRNLDAGFFSVRYNRCTKAEKDFMISMVKCDHLPCTISNVATQMHRTVRSISPCRGQLINKGMIYATSHAEIDFTVPKFDEFIKRINPNLEKTL